MIVLLELGENLRRAEDKPAPPHQQEMGPGQAADAAAGIANLISGKESYTRADFTVSETHRSTAVRCGKFYVAVKWLPSRDTN